MAIINKTDAVTKLTTPIVNTTDPYLQPTTSKAIFASNLQQYLHNFIDWIFPPTSIDLSGKVLTVKRTIQPDNTHGLSTNINYSNIGFETMMPLGGIVMYPMNGHNVDMGGGVILPKFYSDGNPITLDGFLFCDGSTIDLNISGNEIYRNLKILLDGYGYDGGRNEYGSTDSGAGNNIADSFLHLPNMCGRVPMGYDSAAGVGGRPGNTIATSDTDFNYGQVGNSGGLNNNSLTGTNIPAHSHGAGTLKTGANQIYGSGGLTNSNGYDLTQNPRSGPPGQIQIPIEGNTDNGIGINNLTTGAAIENRMLYTVMNYIIKY